MYPPLGETHDFHGELTEFPEPELEQREDGWYAQYGREGSIDCTGWMGPYETAYDARKYTRLVFCVE